MARTLYEKAKEDWQNDPDLSTPIMAEDLEHIEQGIYDNSENMALKEIYHDNAIRLSSGNEEPTTVNTRSMELGYKAKAPGIYSAAIGNGAEALESNSFSTGYGTRSAGSEQFSCGRFNEEADWQTVFIIGFGTSDSNRANIHTVDYKGNAYFKGDVSNDQYSLNAIGARLASAGTVDVTEESVVTVSDQILEVTVPLNNIIDIKNSYGFYTVGGSFLGIIYPAGMVPMLFSLQTAAVINGEVSGKAVLVNQVPSSVAALGYKFDGEIELLSTDITEPKVKVTFDLGRSATINYFTIYRTAGSAVDFAIAELRADMQSGSGAADDLPSYDDVLALLDEEDEEVVS